MSIEQHRRQYICNIESEINLLEKSIKRDEEVLKNIKSLNLSEDILKIKQQEIKNNIDRKNNDILDLKNKIETILSGKLDSDILKKNEPVKKTKQVPNKPEIKHISVKNNYRYEPSKRDYDYHYKNFMKIKDTVPYYIKRNLSEMPNNKGYIWRGCMFFGELPAEKGQNVILFERMNDKMMIYETDKEWHLTYEKYGQERRRLVKQVPRKKTNIGFFI